MDASWWYWADIVVVFQCSVFISNNWIHSVVLLSHSTRKEELVMFLEIDGNIINLEHVKCIHQYQDGDDGCTIRFVDGTYTACPVNAADILAKIREYENNHSGQS
jgi:hypothetical protein